MWFSVAANLSPVWAQVFGTRQRREHSWLQLRLKLASVMRSSGAAFDSLWLLRWYNQTLIRTLVLYRLYAVLKYQDVMSTLID